MLLCKTKYVLNKHMRKLVLKNTPRCLAIATFMVSAAPAFAQTQIAVSVVNLRSSDGELIVSLCDETQYGHWDTCRSQTIPAEPELSLVFNDVLPGRYGISIIHDSNENGEFDLHWYGKPKEAYGASNNPRSRLGAPKFMDIAFTVDERPVEQIIRMRGGE